jgi:hypothetical protein
MSKPVESKIDQTISRAPARRGDAPQPDRRDAVPSAPSPASGISNRQSPEAEAREREEHPPIDTQSPPPEDAAGRVGEAPLQDMRDRHTSHKAGSRSIAQKEDEARYPDRSMPPSRKVDGAFGKEP